MLFACGSGRPMCGGPAQLLFCGCCSSSGCYEIETLPKKRRKRKQVPLLRRTILNGHCTMLTPGPITNSGECDNGGWMDRVGITAAGLDHIYNNAIGLVECFYSNDAYAKKSFCTIHIELHPPLECIGIDSTIASLSAYLISYCRETEHAIINDYRDDDDDDTLNIETTILNDVVPTVLPKPSYVGSSATCIIQLDLNKISVPADPAIESSSSSSSSQPSTTTVALVHFASKGNVLFKACNLERHSPPLNHQQILASIALTPSANAYYGSDMTFTSMRSLAAVSMQSFHGGRDTNNTISRDTKEPLVITTTSSSLIPFSTSPVRGSRLLRCAKCHKAAYCSRDNQILDWTPYNKGGCTNCVFFS